MAGTTPQKKVIKSVRPSAATDGKTKVPRPVNAGKATAAKPAALNQRALVVGVSQYRVPIPKLPAVAADVREVAKVLASRYGTFTAEGVTTLLERNATRDEVLAVLKKAFTGAKADETIFVYLAGHGAVEAGAYYYVAYDTNADRLAETGVPLTAIKQLFDRTASRKVFLLLDFCHSGGITERGTAASDVSAIQREIGVVQGSGKMIFAACAPAQSAYEDSGIGHGLFTHALLRGLKGEAKNAHGEVTALSLYEFIDHEVKHPKQQPTLSAQVAGRIVFAYYPSPGGATPAKPPISKKSTTKGASAPKTGNSTSATRITSLGDLLLLDRHTYITQSIKDVGSDKIEVKIVARDGEEEAALRSLRGDRFHSKRVGVAYGNQAFDGKVEEAVFDMSGGKTLCTATIRPENKGDSYMANMGYNNLTPERMAEMRARILLLDEKPSIWEEARDSSLRSFVLGPLTESGINGGILPSLYKNWKGTQADFLRTARLWAIYHLKTSSTCDDVFELALGALRNGTVTVVFRGHRKSQYSNQPAHEIVVKGSCTLNG